MQPSQPQNLPMFTLLLMISFASVNAVLFTPGLPDITQYFAIKEDTAQLTISWFLIGYAFGQLVYGPVANRFGRKPTLYMGIGLQIASSLLCVVSGLITSYPLLVISRFLLALGAGVGLKMTFTMVNECYEPKVVSQKIAFLMLAFAITPALSVALGGWLTRQFGWMSCFYAGALYGVILLILVSRLPETQFTKHKDAFKLVQLIQGYSTQMKNLVLVAGGLLMGCCTCFVYVFAAEAPFLAMNVYGLSTTEYGVANLIPPIGLIAGSIVSGKLADKIPLHYIIHTGIIVSIMGCLWMAAAVYLHADVINTLFLPMILVYGGVCLIAANASAIAMSTVKDKAHGSAMMNFLNMGLPTVIVLSLGLFPIHIFLLPILFFLICIFMLFLSARFAL